MTVTRDRFPALDALRGIAMILMALDHVRDFFHRGAMSFSPTDLTKTTPAIFLTRWITHFCMPVFMFTAGLRAFLWWRQHNCTLDYLLMTLGPALLAFWFLDHVGFRSGNPLLVFGRVPFSYFVVHFFAIHTALALLCWTQYGSAAFSFIFHPVPSFGGPSNLFPPNFGYRLRTVYLVWILLLGLLYPLCLRFGKIKLQHRQWWLRYL